jgi:ribosomal protein L7/L12
MDTIPENDCNSKELSRLLVGSIQRLLDMNQWNDMMRSMAVHDPFSFIEDVAKYGDIIEKERDTCSRFHLVINGVTLEGARDKIFCIKTLRGMFGWGLSESKTAFEKLPGSGSISSSRAYAIISAPFSSQQMLLDSNMWQDFKAAKNLFIHEVKQMPLGVVQTIP